MILFWPQNAIFFQPVVKGNQVMLNSLALNSFLNSAHRTNTCLLSTLQCVSHDLLIVDYRQETKRRWMAKKDHVKLVYTLGVIQIRYKRGSAWDSAWGERERESLGKREREREREREPRKEREGERERERASERERGRERESLGERERERETEMEVTYDCCYM